VKGAKKQPRKTTKPKPHKSPSGKRKPGKGGVPKPAPPSDAGERLGRCETLGPEIEALKYALMQAQMALGVDAAVSRAKLNRHPMRAEISQRMTQWLARHYGCTKSFHNDNLAKAVDHFLRSGKA
jgi:hypothetical protein